MTSLKQIEANRENGKKAKGKKTIWGKIKSSKNALKHGITCVYASPKDKDKLDAVLKEINIGLN